MSPKSLVTSLLLLAGLAAHPCLGEEADDAPSPTNGLVRVGDMAPDFALESLDGQPVRLSQILGGQPVVLLFWSYFCFPCQREVPDINALYEKLGPEKVRVIGISLDGPQYDNKVRPFLQEKGIRFPNAYDRETEQFFETAERYGVFGTPTLFVVDPQGRIRFINLGRVEGPILSGIIDAARDQSFCPEIVKPARER